MFRRAVLTPIALCLSLVSIAGCVSEATVFSGLKPTHPPPLIGGCATVTSLKPTIRWEKVPSGNAMGADANITNVTYELRIWKESHEAPGELLYAREGLTEPSHEVQEPLPPSAGLFWSVRARFLWNGAPRLTDWGQQMVMFHRVRVPKPGELAGDLVDHQYYRYFCFRTPP